MASDQQFCLRWNNHQSTLVSVFDNLLESQTLVDCTLAADGQYLKAHKVVLSACSPYLEAILCQNLDKHPILILKDVKFSELKAMLDYMYRGEVNISQEQLSTFLKAAESLQIKGLTDSGGGGINDRDPPKRQDLRKPLNQPVPHIPQPRPVVPHPGLMERRSLPHFPPHIADMQPQSPRHAREGSTSPTARKRRRPNRPSSDDSNFVSTPNSLSENQPDTSDSCDVPVKQATSSTPNVPNATTKAPETDSNRTTPQPQNNQQNSEQKQQVTVKKEFSETLLTPKTEFDYGNDNSMEDVTYEDDEEEEVDLSKPGTSFAANSQGFPPWQMGGDGSNDDSNNMYSQDVTAATNQNNSQGEKNSSLIKGKSPISKNSPQKKIVTWDQSPSRLRRLPKEIQVSPRSDKNQVNNGSPVNSPGKGRDNCVKTSGYGKRALCSGCDEYVLKGVIRLHKKYYCGKEFDEKEWKINGRKGVCRRCCKSHEPDSIEFHVKYICGKKPITVQCFYCPNLYRGYRNLLSHMNLAHKKRHCFLDLISVLPAADSIGSKNSTPKIVKNFFSSMLNTQQEAVVAENKMSYSPFVQLRDKTTHKCESCGKNLMGTHEYVNHVNTKCESEKKYPCFYCSFKSILAYEVLDHMEENHGKTFNTFDIIQARLTGIIPMIDEDLNNTASLSNESPTSKTSGSPRKPIKREELDIIAKPSFSNEKHSSVNDCQTTVVSVGECPGKNYQDGDNLSLNELKDFFVTENNDEVSHRKVNDKRVKIENSDSATPVKKISIQNESGDVNKSFEVDKSQIVDQTYSQERKLNADGFGRKGSRDSPGSLSNNQTSVSVTSKNTICASENKNRLSHNPLPEPDSFVSETPDEVIVCESPIPCCSQETFQLRNSFTENSKSSMLTGGCKSPVKVVGKKSPKHAYIKQEDPEIGFANEKLFEPYLNTPSRGSQSKTNNKVDFKNKNKLVMKQEFSNMKENGTGEEISSDSEVDFANKELFEPYSTPIKVTRASLVSSKLNKKNEEINKGDSPSKRERKSAHPTSNNEDTKKKIGKKKKTALSCNGDEILSDRVVSKKALLRANKITKSIVCRSKVNFNVSRKKIVIGKKVVKAISKKTAVPKINCPKCQKDVHPGNLRIHNRYHCLNEPTKKQWILYAGKAYCLKCRKFRSSDSIDFHVKFVCTKKKLSFQCFYCTKILKDIRSVLVHMFKAHGKKHYFQDFMTILTEAENGSPQKTPQAELVQTEPKQSPKVLRHPVIFYAPMKICGQDVSANLEDRLEEHYGCLYCEHQDLMAYKTLDHMEDVHNKKHNMYDLLYAKIPATLKEKELDCAESSNGS